MHLKGNFFHKRKSSLRWRRFRFRRHFFRGAKLDIFAAAIVAVVVAGAGVSYAIIAKRAYDEGLRGKAFVESAQEAALALDFARAKNDLVLAEASFVRVREDLSFFDFLRCLPWFRDQAEAVSSALTTSIMTVSALEDIFSLGEDMLQVVQSAALLSGRVALSQKSVVFGDMTRDEKQRVLKALFEAPPLLQGSKAKMDLALAVFQSISEEKVAASLKKALRPMEEKLPELRRVVAEAMPAAEILPQILGYPQPKTYLFLLQNNSELRPTGGFIGTYGIMKLDSGDLSTFATDNIYKLDWLSDKLPGEPAPAPMQKYLEVQKWFMRDANWSPDFPTSARKAEELYLKEITPHLGLIDRKDPWYATVEPSVDGVIAMTPEVMKDILKMVGEVRIEDQVFTSDNLVDALEYQVEKGFAEKNTPDIQRKEIVGKLAEEVKNRLFRLPASEWPKVLDIVRRAFREKNLLIYDKSPQLQELIRLNNWDGALIDTDGDYLMVVDANMASLKTDPFVERRVEYSMQQRDGEMVARVKLTYTNTGIFSWKTTRYRTYTRLYVPRGSELVFAEGMMENDRIKNPVGRKGKADVSDDLGKTVFGAFLSVEPGETRSMTFEYRLPEGVRQLMERGIYNLYVQKQPGIGHVPLTAELYFDTTVKNWLPRLLGEKTSRSALRFTTDFREDRAFGVRFESVESNR